MNLLGVVFKLTEAERKLLVDVIGRHDPEKLVIDYNDLERIGFLGRERVIAALRHHSYVRVSWAAIALIRKLRGG
jgi:hypothetical protein